MGTAAIFCRSICCNVCYSGCFSGTRHSNRSRRFSVGLRSGLQAGQSILVTLTCCRTLSTGHALWGRALSSCSTAWGPMWRSRGKASGTRMHNIAHKACSHWLPISTKPQMRSPARHTCTENSALIICSTKIKNTRKVKWTLFNWTKQDKMREDW